MKAVKDFLEVCSNWLLGQIQTRIIGVAFIVASTLEITNRLDLSILFTDANASHAMDVAWWADFIISGITLVNYICRKPQEFLEQLGKCLQRLLPR